MHNAITTANAIATALGLTVLMGCARHPTPTEHLAASIAAAHSAQTAGAEQQPKAELHLKLAEDQIAQARALMERGDNERADAMIIRAYNDATLALALTRAAQRESTFLELSAAHPNVEVPAGVLQFETTDAPGPSAPSGEPERATHE